MRGSGAGLRVGAGRSVTVCVTSQNVLGVAPEDELSGVSQDTPLVKSTYDAIIHVPAPLRALMSAVAQPSGATGESARGPGFNSWRFRQAVPIPSYLVALAVGELEGKSIGPNTTVTALLLTLILFASIFWSWH